MKRSNQMIKKLSVAAFTMMALAGFGLSSASANGFDVVDENGSWPVAEEQILNELTETHGIYVDENGVWPSNEEKALPPAFPSEDIYVDENGVWPVSEDHAFNAPAFNTETTQVVDAQESSFFGI